MKQPNQGKWLDGRPVDSNPSKGLGFRAKKAVDARHKGGHDEAERS
jgi:hypothetical protein